MDEANPIELKSEVETLAEGAAVSLFSKFGSRGLLLATQIVLARALGPAGFGLFAVGLVVFQLFTQAGTLGLPVCVIRFGAAAEQESHEKFWELLRHILFLTFFSGLAFGGGLALCAPWLAIHIFRQPELTRLLQVFGAVTCLAIWLNVLSAVTRISKKMQYSAFSLDLAPFIVYLVALVVMILVFKLTAIEAAAALLAGYAVGAVSSIIFVLRLYPDIHLAGSLSSSRFSSLLKYSLPNLGANMFNLWLPNVTILILGTYLASKQVGIFQAAEQVSMLSAIVLLAFSNIFSSQIGILHQHQDMQKLNELFKVSTKWGLYVSLPLLLVALIMPVQVMMVVFGTPYGIGGGLLVLLILGQLVNTATGSAATVLSMTHHQDRLLLWSGIAFVTCVILNMWLIPIFGSTGAAISLGAAIALLNILLLQDVWQLLHLWPYEGHIYKMVIASVITGAMILIASHILPTASLYSLAGITLLSITMFYAILFVLGPEENERHLWFRMIHRSNQHP